MSARVCLRNYVEADLAAVVALFGAAVHGLTVEHYDAAQRAAWAPVLPNMDEWRTRLSGRQVLLAEEQGALAGFIACEADGHIDLLFTAPGYSRRGVASQLYSQVEASLRAEGIAELRTEASLVARPFFEHQGFDVVLEEEVFRGGVALRRFAMRKPLLPA